MKKQQIHGFTLVELVVVATILAILGAVGFVSYTGYISGARDANRIAQLASIHDGLNILTAESTLPLPEDNVEIIIGSETIAYQGYAGQNILDTIGYQKGGKDPKDDTYFTYYLDAKRSSFQLMAFLEEEGSTAFFRDEAYANDYSARIPTVYGSKLGVMTDQFNSPIQEIESIQTNGSLNISSTSDIYKAYIDEDEIIEGDSSSLIAINPDTSCERIKEARGAAKSTYYTLHPNGDGIKYRIFCNMNGETTNLVTEKWEVGSGGQGNYSRNGSEAENNRESGLNPIGTQDILWKASPDSVSGGDGGWNYDDVPVDSSKTYRVSSWFKKTGNLNNGRAYIGTLGNVSTLPGGAGSGTNPYFWNGFFPELDKWYLVVGYIHPTNYTGPIRNGGAYSTDSIEREESITVEGFKFNSGVTTSRHRSYLFYTTTTLAGQFFYNPRFEEIPAGKVGDISDLLPVRVN